MSGVGDGRYSGENKQTDSCEKKSSEGKKVVVVQPGWQYFNAKFKISLGSQGEWESDPCSDQSRLVLVEEGRLCELLSQKCQQPLCRQPASVTKSLKDEGFICKLNRFPLQCFLLRPHVER